MPSDTGTDVTARHDTSSIQRCSSINLLSVVYVGCKSALQKEGGIQKQTSQQKLSYLISLKDQIGWQSKRQPCCESEHQHTLVSISFSVSRRCLIPSNKIKSMRDLTSWHSIFIPPTNHVVNNKEIHQINRPSIAIYKFFFEHWRHVKSVLDDITWELNMWEIQWWKKKRIQTCYEIWRIESKRFYRWLKLSLWRATNAPRHLLIWWEKKRTATETWKIIRP